MNKKIKATVLWKWLFISLLTINLGVILWLFLVLNVPPADPISPSANETEEKDVAFTIESDKENLNQLIEQYISQLPQSQKVSYSVDLNNTVELSGSVQAFNQQIPATVQLEPEVQENGDLLLQQESIRLGRLQLPNSQVLQYIKRNYEMPEWIEVNPGRENIYVAVTDISNGNIQVRAEQFDLENDEISFSVHAPYESLPFNQRTIMNYIQS
ncbi:YpmS family protein [Salibacterium aidingense]|uniref:YpmS family protein n=1 Tax=Salibacterium aidingense TaxID=384933 RepID=UPI003BE8B382